MSKISELKDRLREQEAFYSSACVQLSVLNVQMDQLSKRFDRVDKTGQKSFRYTLRMRMAVLEGVRNMFYQFASIKAFLINRLRHEILIELAFSEQNSANMDEDSYPVLGRFGHPFFLINGEEDEGDEDEEELDDDEFGTDTEEEEGEEDFSEGEVVELAASWVSTNLGYPSEAALYYKLLNIYWYQ